MNRYLSKSTSVTSSALEDDTDESSVCSQIYAAAVKSFELLLTPFDSNKKLKSKKSFFSCDYDSIHTFIFGNLPQHYPLHKKLNMIKASSRFGSLWDVFMVTLSLIACGQYVCETYISTYHAVQIYGLIEIIITQFFTLDFVYSSFCAPNLIRHMLSPWTFIDILTIVPVYVALALAKKTPNLAIFRFVRILRLVRILRTFKLLYGLSGIKRQMITLSLTLVSLIFMAAGLIQMAENDLKAASYDCRYINAATDWEPSCSEQNPYSSFASGACDCLEFACIGIYSRYDLNNQPSIIRCISLTYLDAFYYMIVTVATVGYGDISPTTDVSKAMVIVFIVTSVVVIPMQVNRVTTLLSNSSAFRKPYNPSINDNHIILCGHVNDSKKLEKFFREFFHPDRTNSGITDYHAVILAPLEPKEDVRVLIQSPLFETRVTYIIGSALSVADLNQCRADIAMAIFFLNDTEQNTNDSATILRTLSVLNYNLKIECYVQIVRSEDRDILKDSNVDVLICLDDYKTVLQSRNSICPGISTLVENLFHSFESSIVQKNMPYEQPWMEEYIHGANMELYYIPLNREYLEILAFEWTLIAEGIYLEYDVMLLGVCSPIDKSVVLNPTKTETLRSNKAGRYASKFYGRHNLGVLLCSDQSLANNVATGLADINVIDRIINKLTKAEEDFAVRKLVHPEDPSINEKASANFGPILSFSIAKTLRRASGIASAKVSSVAGNNSVGTHSKDKMKPMTSIGEEAKSADVRNTTKSPTHTQASVPDTQDGGLMPGPSIGITLKELITISRHHADQGNALYQNDTADFSYDEDDGDQYLGYLKPNANKIEMTWKKGLSTFSRLSGLQLSKDRKRSKSADADDYDDDDGDDDCDYNDDQEEIYNANMLKADQKDGDRRVSSVRRSSVGTVRRGSAPGRRAADTKIIGNMQYMSQIIGTDATNTVDEVEDVGDLKNHIIVFGSTSNLTVFIEELRRPLITYDCYHAVVVVDDEAPADWKFISDKYNDVYFIRGRITSSRDFNRANVRNAHSVIMLANRASVTKVEDEYLDADTLFSYLKLEKHIPRSVFFSVELTCASNIAVLNSTIMSSLSGNEGNYLDTNISQKNQQWAEIISDADALAGNSNAQAIKPKVLRGAFISQNILNRHSNDPDLESSIAIQSKGSRSSILNALTLPSSGNPNKKRSSAIFAAAKAQVLPGDKLNQKRNAEKKKDPDSFWSAVGTHHMLPVFASGRAFIPASIDSQLCHSFYGNFTPLLTEHLICGSRYQTIYQIALPICFEGRYFVDLFRSFLSRSVYVIGVYRSTTLNDKAVLPYVYTCPYPESIMRTNDRLYVFANAMHLRDVVRMFQCPLTHLDSGAYMVGGLEDILTKMKDKKVAQTPDVTKSDHGKHNIASFGDDGTSKTTVVHDQLLQQKYKPVPTFREQQSELAKRKLEMDKRNA